jgi:hypothetical protein
LNRCDEPLTSGRDGLKVVKILETAQKSLENGGDNERVSLEITRKEYVSA